MESQAGFHLYAVRKAMWLSQPSSILMRFRLFFQQRFHKSHEGCFACLTSPEYTGI
jgi:hypothetical protein